MARNSTHVVMSKPMKSRLALTCLAAAGIAALSSPAHAQSVIRPILHEQTPLILKDGRIANVSVHVVPFEMNSDGLSSIVEREFDTKIGGFATDCFLTAQAIGHVVPGDDAEGDTLTAHRLARARSDRVMGLMRDSGIPEASIASVWDWQFMVQEPRVTLWVFELRQGEDCEGKPIDSSAQIASLDSAHGIDKPTMPLAAIDPPTDIDTDAEDAGLLETAPDPVVEVETIEPLEPVDPDLGSTEPATELAMVEPPAVEKVDPAPAIDTAPLPETIDASDADEDPLIPTVEPIEAASLDPVTETDEIQASDGEQELAITFAVNSSYLPRGASGQIREMLKGLPDGSYKAEIIASVGSGDVSGATKAEAKKYNRWMAERRIGRIQEQIDKASSSKPVTVNQEFIENDASRNVKIVIRPVP